MKTADVIDFVVTWLGERCEKSSRRGFVVGVSGGIDSAVTSTLCAKTGMPVRVLRMPIHQAAEQHSLGGDHIEWLTNSFENVESIEIDLTSVMDALAHAVPSQVSGDEHTMANTRARLRMAALYAIASSEGMLVAGTGNRVEDFGVGFFTKYGDGGVDLSPIGDLLKSEVYEVGRELGIIQGILDAVPTDGLWDDSRSDEDQLGASYDEIEWAMAHEASGSQQEQLSDRQKQVLEIYRSLHKANRHKMDPIPVAKIPAGLR
jgi:NAD+ synthase